MINLLPQSVREERAYGRKNKVIFGYVIVLSITAIMVSVVMLGSLSVFGTDEAALGQEITENKVTISSLKTSTSELNSTVTRLDTVNQLFDSGIYFSELIPSIGAILPDGTILNSLSLTGDRTTDPLALDVDLETPELSAVLVKNLVESELFEAADIGAITPKGGDNDRYRYGTTISASFTGSAEEKRKAEAAAKAKAAAQAEASGEGDAE